MDWNATFSLKDSVTFPMNTCCIEHKSSLISCLQHMWCSSLLNCMHHKWAFGPTVHSKCDYELCSAAHKTFKSQSLLLCAIKRDINFQKSTESYYHQGWPGMTSATMTSLQHIQFGQKLPGGTGPPQNYTRPWFYISF